jgi:hypothetical protein
MQDVSKPFGKRPLERLKKRRGKMIHSSFVFGRFRLQILTQGQDIMRFLDFFSPSKQIYEFYPKLANDPFHPNFSN